MGHARTLRLAATGIAAAGLLAAPAATAAPPREPRAGDPAPEFTLRDLGGAPRTLGELRGRVVVLYFAMWCSTCRANALEIQREILDPWKDRGVQALAVDYLGNDPAEVRSLVADLGLTYPVLLDDGTFSRLFGSRMAFTLVVDRGGVIRYADLYDVAKVKALVTALAGEQMERAAPPGPAVRRDAGAGARPPDAAPLPDAWRRPARSILGSGEDEHFGFAVLGRPADLNGDGFPDLAVGSPSAAGGRGGVSVWYGSAGGFAAEPDVTLTGSEDGQRLGGTLLAADLDGDGVQDLVVGDGWARGRRRTVSLFRGSREGLSRVPAWTLRAAAPTDGFGGALAAGDLDGDGLTDLVVGIETPDRRGAVRIFHGRAGGLPGAPDAEIRGEAARDGFGSALTAADLDGDGVAELVAGAPGANGPGTDRGAAYVFVGRKGRPSRPASARDADLIIEGERDMDELGGVVACAGDLDGDGGPELAVAASGSSRAARRAGAVYLFRGLPAGARGTARRLSAGAAAWILADGAAGALFGVSVTAAGDLDGDGIDDLAVGAMNADHDRARAGAVHLYRGRREGRLGPPEILHGTREDGRFGRDVAPLGGSRFAVTEIGNGERARGAGAVHLFAYPRTSDPAECGICGMHLERHRHTRYEVLAKDGSRQVVCGAQCGLRMEAALREARAGAKATDFITGRAWEADGMFFVFGSTAVPDMAPSFIPFARRAEAEAFQRGFGGEVLDHAAALERARRLR